MLIYEVTADVQQDLADEYERYMIERHIPDVIASGCFGGASIVKTGSSRYRIAYWVADDATLKRYLDEHAPALRSDFARRFPRGVELSREVWHTLHRWSAQVREVST